MDEPERRERIAYHILLGIGDPHTAVICRSRLHDVRQVRNDLFHNPEFLELRQKCQEQVDRTRARIAANAAREEADRKLGR